MKEQDECVTCRWTIISHSHGDNWDAVDLHVHGVEAINRNPSSCVINNPAMHAKNSTIRM